MDFKERANQLLDRHLAEWESDPSRLDSETSHESGAQVNAKQIERVCHHYGQALEDENQQMITQQVYKEYEGEQVNQRHYVSVDGAMYLTREESWRERLSRGKLGRIYRQDDRAAVSKDRAMLTDSTYVSHLGHHQDFITKMNYELENLNQLVFIADGARWIWPPWNGNG